MNKKYHKVENEDIYFIWTGEEWISVIDIIEEDAISILNDYEDDVMNKKHYTVSATDQETGEQYYFWVLNGISICPECNNKMYRVSDVDVCFKCKITIYDTEDNRDVTEELFGE